MQIQPRPFTISKKKEEKAESVRKAPPTAIRPLPTIDRAEAQRGDREALRLDGLRVLADGAEREAERRAGEDEGGDGDGGEGEVGERRLREGAGQRAAARRARCAAAS